MWGTEVPREVHGMQPGYYWVEVEQRGSVYDVNGLEVAFWDGKKFHLMSDEFTCGAGDLKVGPRVRGQEERT